MISALRPIIYGLVPYDIVLTDDDIRHGRIAEETYGFFEFGNVACQAAAHPSRRTALPPSPEGEGLIGRNLRFL